MFTVQPRHDLSETAYTISPHWPPKPPPPQLISKDGSSMECLGYSLSHLYQFRSQKTSQPEAESNSKEDSMPLEHIRYVAHVRRGLVFPLDACLLLGTSPLSQARRHVPNSLTPHTPWFTMCDHPSSSPIVQRTPSLPAWPGPAGDLRRSIDQESRSTGCDPWRLDVPLSHPLT